MASWRERWGTARGRAVVWRCSGGAHDGGTLLAILSSPVCHHPFSGKEEQRTAEFTSIPLGTFTPISCVVTVVLFGNEHTLWLAGTMAGAIYNLLLYRTRRLWPCVLAHGVTNLLLGVPV